MLRKMKRKNKVRLHITLSKSSIEIMDKYINNSFGTIKSRSDILDFLVTKLSVVEFQDIVKFSYLRDNAKFLEQNQNQSFIKDNSNTYDAFIEKYKKQVNSFNLE